MKFSEKLHSAEDLGIFLANSSFYLKLVYYSDIDIDEPKLISWNMTKFDNYEMTLQLEFNNASRVSSGLKKDRLSILVLEQEVFLSKSDFRIIQEDY